MKWTTLLLVITARLLLGQSAISLINTPLSDVHIAWQPPASMMKISMQLTNGMAFVQAEAAGKSGLFLLDTGAPILVVNQKPDAENSVSATSFSNSFIANHLNINDFRWSLIHKKSLEAIAVDLSHMETSSGLTLQGIIGFDVLKNFELFLDYKGKQLILLPPRKKELQKTAKPLLVIPFELQEHLPVVQVEIAGQRLRFGLDTGAGANLIDQKWLHNLSAEAMELGDTEGIRGVDQEVKQVKSAAIKNTKITDTDFGTMKFLFTDLSYLQSSTPLRIDGLLGYDFFQKVKCSINYEEQLLYIWNLE